MKNQAKYGIIADIVRTKTFKRIEKQLIEAGEARTFGAVRSAFGELSEKCDDSADFFQLLVNAYYPGAVVSLSKVDIRIADIESVINMPYIPCNEMPGEVILKYLSNYDCGAVIIEVTSSITLWES